MEIRSDIPYPKDVNYRVYKDQKSLYPFDDMNVGDSFEIYPKAIDSVRNLASRHGAKNKTKFSILPYKDHYRCWRVK